MSGKPKWNGRGSELNLLEKQINDNEYLRRPFFISRIADLGPDRFREAQGEPVAEIMESIVRREGPRLIGDSSDLDAQFASDLYGQVLSEVARMMMDDETDGIEADLVGLLVEEVFAEHTSREMVNALSQRAHALALLEEDAGDPRRRRFPHETVRAYFFARNIFEYFPEHGATNGLYRIPLSTDDFRIFNRVARRRSMEEQYGLRTSMLDKLREATSYDYLRSNVAGLLLSFAPLQDDEDTLDGDSLVLANLELLDVWMADLLGAQKTELHGCRINRLDVRGADLRQARFSNTKVFELLADSYVKFGETVPDVQSLIVYEQHQETPLYGHEANDWISTRRSTADDDGPDPDERLTLLHKFARISMRQYAIRSKMDLNDPTSRKILDSPLWPSLRELLERHGRLEVENIAASGPSSEWFHLVAGAEFLDPESAAQDSTRRILEELSAPL